MSISVAIRICGLAMLASLAFLHGNASAQPRPSIPDHAGQVILIKNTITAVNHGNITGNFTVLRDLASERFRRQNTAGDLAKTFQTLKARKLDLSPILVAEPTLTQRPGVDNFRQRLRLVGHFPTRPQAVRFDLIFQHVEAGWMIDEVSVAVAPTESIVQPTRKPTPLRRTPATSVPQANGNSRPNTSFR